MTVRINGKEVAVDIYNEDKRYAHRYEFFFREDPDLLEEIVDVMEIFNKHDRHDVGTRLLNICCYQMSKHRKFVIPEVLRSFKVYAMALEMGVNIND